MNYVTIDIYVHTNTCLRESQLHRPPSTDRGELVQTLARVHHDTLPPCPCPPCATLPSSLSCIAHYADACVWLASGGRGGGEVNHRRDLPSSGRVAAVGDAEHGALEFDSLECLVRQPTGKVDKWVGEWLVVGRHK